jgi:myo-inositol-1-phosphate synthase
MSLPIFTTQDKDLSMLQTKWASELNPILTNPISNGILIKGINLVAGANVVNHKLGRKLQGWIVTRWNGGVANVYDTQDSNQMQQLTLNLNSSANVSIDLYVF